jgi:endonuclease/exonuclease/phosphatase family metal-dependent hydrolase
MRVVERVKKWEWQECWNLLVDTQEQAENNEPLKTWSAHCQLKKIDHVFVHPTPRVLHVDVPKTQLKKIASDHLPLIVELRL